MTSKTSRRLAGTLIIGFWLLMTGLLVERELGGRRMLAPAAPATGPSDTWMGVFLGDGQRVGHVHLVERPESRDGRDGASMELEARMSLNLLGKSTDLDVAGSVWRPRDGTTVDFGFAVRSADYDFQVDGRVADGKLAGEIRSAGEVLPLELPVGGDVVFSSALGSALTLPHLEVGEQVLVDSFDPLTLRRSTARLRAVAHEQRTIAGETLDTLAVTVETGGIRSRAWLDANGEVVRAETPIGLVIEKIAPQTAATAAEPGADELLALTAIHPAGARPFRGAHRMLVELTGLEDLDLPVDGVQQRLDGARYRLAVPPTPDGSGIETAAEVEIAPHLAADAFVQSEHPKIRLKAAAIVGAEADPWRRALALYEWVYTRLDKEPVVSIPSALEVLAQRRGDCNEHTVLFTALARAAGLPTRIAIGLVWSDELDGFYYHAWPEVYLGRWIWMDPTLGQPLADATHLKLLNGGIESWPRLLPYLGNLRIDVLEIE